MTAALMASRAAPMVKPNPTATMARLDANMPPSETSILARRPNRSTTLEQSMMPSIRVKT